MPTADVPPLVPCPGTLEITEIRIQPQHSNALKAFVSITLNDSFVVRGLKVIEGMEGRFVAMPARRRKDNTFQDVAHPITQRFRDYMESMVLRAYLAKIGELSEADGEADADSGFAEASPSSVVHEPTVPY